jgi:hypothetical protein
MVWLRCVALSVAAVMLAGVTAGAQEMPADYKAVLSALGKKGDFKDGVLKVNIPRNDLRVTINQRPAPTPFGFGGWVAVTKGQGMDVMIGDLVLTEDEVNPVMSAVLQNGLEVTALHNYFFWEQPRIFYMHVHGMGSAADLAKRVKPAIDLIDQAAKQAAPPSAPAQSSPTIDGAALAKIIGTPGEQTGPVYKTGRHLSPLLRHRSRRQTGAGCPLRSRSVGEDAVDSTVDWMPRRGPSGVMLPASQGSAAIHPKGLTRFPCVLRSSVPAVPGGTLAHAWPKPEKTSSSSPAASTCRQSVSTDCGWTRLRAPFWCAPH